MPLPNFHSARMIDPDTCACVRYGKKGFGDKINVIWCAKDGKTQVQAFRFPKDKWTSDQAKDWLDKHDYKPIKFEPARESLNPAEFLNLLFEEFKTGDTVYVAGEPGEILTLDNGEATVWMDDGRLVPVSKSDLKKSAMENLNPDPTPLQSKAGNYKKYFLRIGGLDISIENHAGSVRQGMSKDGHAWQNNMNHHYGYIKGTKGKDKDHFDCFVNPSLCSILHPDAVNDAGATGDVYVINQVNPKTGEFDEHKVMIGFKSEDDAKNAYLSNYEHGWKGLGSIKMMPLSEFKTWVFDGTKNKPIEKLTNLFTFKKE